MHQKITLIQGHPDPKGRHFGHALADSYVRGALAEGHEIKVIEIAQIDFPLLRSQAEWNDGTTPPSLREAQAAIAWADHLVVIFPLWLGTMPAVLKGFLEQVLRPGFERFEQLGLLLGALLLGADEQEIENDDHQDHRNDRR